MCMHVHSHVFLCACVPVYVRACIFGLRKKEYPIIFTVQYITQNHTVDRRVHTYISNEDHNTRAHQYETSFLRVAFS